MLMLFKEDLNKLITWSEKWRLGFNHDKSKTMHICHKFSMAYRMAIRGNIWKLNDSNEEIDLGIMMPNNPKPSLQCS